MRRGRLDDDQAGGATRALAVMGEVPVQRQSAFVIALAPIRVTRTNAQASASAAGLSGRICPPSSTSAWPVM